MISCAVIPPLSVRITNTWDWQIIHSTTFFPTTWTFAVVKAVHLSVITLMHMLILSVTNKLFFLSKQMIENNDHFMEWNECNNVAIQCKNKEEEKNITLFWNISLYESYYVHLFCRCVSVSFQGWNICFCYIALHCIILQCPCVILSIPCRFWRPFFVCFFVLFFMQETHCPYLIKNEKYWL